MPPKRGIVKSGNAGNSSKPSKPAASSSAAPAIPEEKPLFPPGSKFPASLLHERCQKNGWEKPVIDTRKQGNGYTFSVTLSRINKKTSQRESVRLEPHPPCAFPTILEARHWGATYALYRFCNGIQLNRVLPPGPREYWNELAMEHKNAPDHQAWMYDTDPFAARKAVEERQAAAAKKRDEAPKEGGGSGSSSSSTSPEFVNAPEAKMASSLRDLVEDCIKKAIAANPESTKDSLNILSPEVAPQIREQLKHLGFKPVQIQNAVNALSQQSPLTSRLLRSLPALQACIEYLILQVPECDLPERFLPSVNSSNPFVTAAHAGTDDLRKRWIQDKAVKECGWPVHVVKECMTHSAVAEDWALLLRTLNARLIGTRDAEVTTDSDLADPEPVDRDELESFGAQFGQSGEIIIPLPIAPMQLVVYATNEYLPTRGDPPPLYVRSSSIAAYVRLHLVSRVLTAFRKGALVESGESVIMAALRLIEEEWAQIEDNGPPDMSQVLQHLLPQQDSVSTLDDLPDTVVVPPPRRRGGQKLKHDERTDTHIKEEFEVMRRSKEYARMFPARRRLPAFSSKDQFLSLLEKNQCVVVVGETGSGKTTQLPQFVLDSLILANHGSKASIVVTQPRRLSAIGVAARVSAERLDDGSVGYAIRGESRQDARTKLLFCTTGVLLRRLATGNTLQDVTHVIVDEVHERSVDGDILLLELKELMKRHRNLKVILMSATINHETFVKYFDNAPLLSISGLSYPVEDRYLEDYVFDLSYAPPAQRPSGPAKGRKRDDADGATPDEEDERVAQIVRNMTRSGRIDVELIASLVTHIMSIAEKRGGILIFLPGVQEIRQCVERLCRISNTKVLPLHANLSSDEQRQVFASYREWKIVVATNVAETSITIDDVVYVIDSGRVKETQYDPDTGLTRLTEQWVSRAAARQRRGRAGRTQPGVCYKLYTKSQESQMAAFPIPEIRRVPLESVALSAKVVHDDVKTFLGKAIDPPEMAAIDHALSTLEELAALAPDGSLTPLGIHLSTLPMDLRLGKMLILATIFQCLGPILTIAACLSSKPLFVSPMEKREEATQARARFARGNSDLLTDLHAYEECMRLRSEGKPQNAIKNFCDENYIAVSTIRDITSLRQDFFSSLSDLGFIPRSSRPDDASLNTNSANENLLKAVVLGGLWPRVARVHLPKSAIKFDKIQAGTIQRENTAREFKIYDLKEGRVFLHPASTLFGVNTWRSSFLAYFQKQMTSKVFLRDATEVPIYGLLLFGGPVSVNHIGGGLTVGAKDAFIKLKAWPRIGILVNQLRRLLDEQLKECIEEGTILSAVSSSNPVLRAMLALLTNDGLTS
ncbi:P-loop containing nucleoside triphosphate hydrolase protein [Obba rivulosa]|uniref:RNA helicase n=1 Tax=Obba rivulosa TaxID=1052685 RepID=A0A8E2DTM1_9APHY|nr:P-loop containing nucleoside triphosphate hydrolase protein [Obba rivulosa]